VEDLKPLTAQEVLAWRVRQPVTSPWQVLGLQALAGLILVGLTAAFTGKVNLVASVAWGVLSVCVPALVFARALARQMRQRQAASALVSFFVWELVKILLTVALLLAAPRMVAELNWLALLAGFLLTMKMYWVAMVLGVRRRHRPPEC
jgi:ATP synthase protein I